MDFDGDFLEREIVPRIFEFSRNFYIQHETERFSKTLQATISLVNLKFTCINEM